MGKLAEVSLDLYLEELPSIEEMWAEQLPARNLSRSLRQDLFSCSVRLLPVLAG
jgi:hypothetical protein